MTDFTAKLISMKILLDWQSRKVWSVCQRISEDTSNYRWFKSEDNARAYAALVMGAVVEECVTPTVFNFDDGLFELRQAIAETLDGRRRTMAELSYTHESARG